MQKKCWVNEDEGRAIKDNGNVNERTICMHNEKNWIKNFMHTSYLILQPIVSKE